MVYWAGSDNGSTGALQAFSRSSILRRSTKLWSVSISVSIAACHAAGTGSTPVGTAKFNGDCSTTVVLRIVSP